MPPVPKYEPGRARYTPTVTDDVLNVLPAIDGYKPLPGLKAFVPAFEVLATEGMDGVLGTGDDEILIVGPGGSELSGAVNIPGSLGGIYVRLADGTQALFVGTQTALYRLNFADFTWEDVSGSSAPYAVGVGMRWSFALFGSTVYAQNFNDPEQLFDLQSDSVFEDNATAPVAAYLAVVGPFLVRGRLLSDEAAVQWSAPENPASNEAGIDNSDIQTIPEGGEVMGIVPVSAGFVVLMRESTHLMNFVPSSGLVFVRQVLNTYRGCIAPYSVRVIGQDDFIFYSKDGFFRGMQMQPIGAERLDPWFQENIDFENRIAMISGADFRRKMAWLRVLMSDGSYRLFGYQWQLDLWTVSNADMADIFQAETAGVTIDQMDTFFPTIDDINVPYDSSFWDGGAPELYGINTDGFLVAMNGEPMAARVATNDLTFNGMKRSYVNGARAVIDAVNFTAQLSSANYRGAPFTAKNPVSPTTRSRFLSLRGDGQVHRVLFEVPEGEDWTTFTEFEIDAQPSGGA